MAETMTPTQQPLTPQQTDDLKDLVTQIGKSVALGLVPFLGQAIDIYDTAWAAYDLYGTRGAPSERQEAAYFDIAMALIGWIPGPGDAIKKTLKTVNKDPQRYAPLLLDAVRQALYAAGYKVDPHQFLLDSISAGKVRELLDNARAVVQGSSVYAGSPPAVQTAMLGGLDTAAHSLPLLVGVVERKVAKWLKLAPKSTTQAAQATQAKAKGPDHGRAHDPAHKPPPHQQGKDAAVGRDGKPNAASAQRGTVNAAQIGQASLNQLQEGLGEHVADYHCHHDLKWGRQHSGPPQHDRGQTASAKLSDGGLLRQLGITPQARGVGIDAVWHPATHHKPYAIAEYKARAVPMTANGMRGLLVSESAQDKTLQPAKRKERAGYRRSQKTGPPNMPQPTPLPQSVPKMSHLWIAQRVKKVAGLTSTVIDNLEDQKSYTRHVVLVVTSVGAGLTHSLQIAEGQIDETKHASHAVGVSVYGESERVFTEAASQTQTEKPETRETSSTAKGKSKKGK